MTKQYRGKNNCANCGHQHSGACHSRVKGCSNCKVEGHGAFDPQCPKLKREYEIASIRDQHKVGYAKATNILNKQKRSAPAENYGNQGAHGAPGSGGNKNRKHSNIKTAIEIKSTIQKQLSNCKVGGTWTDNKGEGNGKSSVKPSKDHRVKAKNTKRQTNPTTPPPPPIIDGKGKSYAMAVSPKAKLNNSQIAGTSWMVVPKITSNEKQKSNEEFDQSFPISLSNKFDILNRVNCEKEDNTEQYTLTSTPQRNKIPLILSPESNCQTKNKNKKRKKHKKK